MEDTIPLTGDDGEVREWTDEDFARAVPFSALPAVLQRLLSSEKRVVPDAETMVAQQPAA